MSNAGADVDATLKNLGADSADPFAIFSDVTDYYRDVLDKKREIARVKKAEQVEWEKQNPELAKKFASFMNNVLPVIDWEAIPQKPDAPTRTSSALILAEFASKIDNMIVSSADLANSDMTEGFLKASKPFKKGDFTGGFLHAGVAELTMAAVMNGIASHGGVIAACGTFFVFSDYMKPAMRMAALMELPVKYIWTHDTFRVGEDGPTHQPIEQEAQARLLEKIANLHGKRSMLVLRPADTAETKAAWKMAIENFNGPTALLLSRQVMTDIPVKSQSSTRFAEAIAGSNVGAYAVVDGGDNPDLILIANGAEVITCIDSAQALKKDHGLNVRVISAISEGLFKDQDKDYRESLIPFGKPVMAFTAGLPVNFAEMIGPFGKTIGLPRFGESAPFKVLEETFGYTVENVVKQALGCVEECKVMVERVKSLC
jgi:transketolase